MNISEAAAALGSLGGKAGVGDSKRRDSAKKASLIAARDRGKTILERLKMRISPEADSNGCWIWQSTLNKKGYGLMSVAGKQRTAHRLIWAEYFGTVKSGMHVLHRCDNRRCVNPEHLFLGTNLDNILDAVKKGRRRGPQSWTTNTVKLKVEDVLEIRRLRGLMRQVDIASKYGITAAHVRDIQNRACWKTV